MRLRSAASIAVQIALLGLIAFALMLRAPQVTGLSMEPRIDSGEYVLINTLEYRFGRPRRGDIIAFRHERSAPSVYLKRVVALPGERVAIKKGMVVIDGAPLAEPYVRFRDARSARETTIPAGTLYVLGDNRANSDDSRAWGTVPAQDVIGRAMFGVWPLSRVGAL